MPLMHCKGKGAAIRHTGAAMPTQPLLEAQDLRVERGGRPLVEGLDLRLAAGDALWLRGRNGCGKSTLLRTLAGLRAPAAGRLTRHAPLRYLGHARGLRDELTVQEQFEFSAQLAGLRPDAAALRHFGLQRLARRPLRCLSAGQRQRAALAPLALPQQQATLWLLDEPFDALDPEGVQQLAELLQAHAAAGGAWVAVSHQAVPGLCAAERRLDA
jgi:heme exporter protein A